MPFNFCPNLSHLDNKKIIDKVGLDKFYQKYYEEHFDLNPNKSVMDKLFVNIDKFTDSQQRSVVNSIIYNLEEAKKDGYSKVDDLFQYVRDMFSNTLEEDFIPANADGSLNDVIQVFKDIDNNWDRFKEKTIEKLRGIGVKVTKTIDDSTASVQEEDTDHNYIDEESPEESFEGTEANYQRDNYSDSFSQSISAKNTASAHLKLKLSLIPDTVLENGKLVPAVNFLAMPEFMDLDKVWTTLQGILTGLESSEIYSTITELAKDNPMYSAILDSIQSDPNTNIQNEFVVAFSKRQARPLTVKIGYADKAGNRTINIFGTNRAGATDILVDTWYDRFKQSPLVNDDGSGNLVVNNELAKKALASFNNFLSKYDIRDKYLNSNLQKGLDSIGINLSIDTIDNLIKNGTKIDGVPYSGAEFLKKYVSNIFKRIAGEFSNTEEVNTEEEDSKLHLNNPFISETTALKQLAKLENITNPFLYESSYVGGDGKPRYSITNNNYISKIFNKLNNPESRAKVVESILSTTYGANSIWANKLKAGGKFAETFSLGDVDSLGTNESKVQNKTFSKMSNKEKEFSRMAYFQNNGRGNTSIFLGLIPSDKTTIPLISAERVKVVIDTTTLEVRNSEAINSLYTPFISEYNRIREVQAQQKDPKFKDKLIEGYHNGMGEKFLVYDFLNGDKELFDDKGNLKIVDDKTLKNTVTPKIQEFTKDLIKNQMKYWKQLGLLDRKKIFDKNGNYIGEDFKSPIFDKTYKTQLGNFETDSERIRAFAADYAINQFIANFNYTQLIGGDPALHGKATIAKTWINYSKRLAKDIAPGLDGSFVNPNFTTIFLKDLKYTSKQFNEYQQVLGEKSNAYKDLNPADAQEYTTLKEHLSVMDAYGKLDPISKAAGERLMKGGGDPFDIDLILQPMKPVYVGTMVDKSMGINRIYYIKTSAFPLIPSLTKGLEIDKLRVAMETGKIDRAVYESGVKLGLGTITQNVQSDTGEFNNLDLKGKGTTLDRDGFRIQQEVPYHGNRESFTNESSQGRKLILSDVDDDSKLDIFDHTLTGKDAKQLYEDLHIEKMNRAFNGLLKDIGATKNKDGSLDIKDLSKLQQILLDEATNRNYNINDIYGLQLETDEQGKQRFIIPLGFNTNSSRLESIMNSLFTNRVIKSELPGFSKIQGSSVGFNKLRTIDQLNSQVKDSIIWVNPKDVELNYIRKNESGTKLLQADILVPSWFTDKAGNDVDLTKFIKEDGTLDIDRLPENLLSTIGIRIPTQGLNSMMSFKVKGFLPKIVGDLAIVPAEIVAQMGSDFDVDKLYMYRYHHTFDGERFTKIELDLDLNVSEKLGIGYDIDQQSNEQLDNAIIQFYEDRYKDVDLLPKILEPNGFGNLPKLSEEISKILNLEDKHNFFTTEAQNTIHKNNNDGKAGTGIFSLFSTFIKAAQDAKLELSNPIKFKVDNKVKRATSLYSKGFTEGKNPSTVVSYFQSASVDNAKEQILGSLNINSQTMDVAGILALAGYDEDLIAHFLSQPIIREYVEQLSNTNDITNPEYNVNKEQVALDKTITNYNLSGEDAEELSQFKLYKTGSKYIYSSEDMVKELSEPTTLNQRILLEQYLSIKNQAKAIRLVQNAINTDTSGLGIRYVDLQVKKANIDLVRYGSKDPTILNTDKLFNNTQIGKATEVLNSAIELYSKILPYATPAYKYSTSEILKNMGKADKSEIYSKDLDSIYKTFKSFLYSDKSLLGIDDVNAKRNELIYGSQALGNRWEEYAQTPAGKKNLLGQRILVRRGTTKNDPIRLEALNTPAANTSDNNESMASYYRMYYKGTEQEKQLAKDLVNYFVLTGAKAGPNSISKYIPYDILEDNQFSSKLHTIDGTIRNANRENLLEAAIEQHFQHNPSSAISFDPKNIDIHNYNLKGFTMSPDSQYLISDGNSGLVAPTYMSNYNRDLKDFVLYKISKSTPLGSEYSRIDLLGDKGVDEYNANTNEGQYSLIKDNQSNLQIPSNINKRIEEDKSNDLPFEKDDVTVKPVIDKEYLKQALQLDNSNIKSTLNTISSGEDKELANVANDLKFVLVNYPDLKIDTNEKRDNVTASYNPESDTISINLDNLESKSNALQQGQRSILHEVLHAITSNKINNYDNLSDQDKKSVDKIRILYNKYKRSVDQTELFKFNDLTRQLKTGKSISREDIDWYIQNKGKYYALESLHEFVAAGLTDTGFTQQLKDNNFWDQLWKAISGLLGLNESYKNDYEALYNTALDLGGKDGSTDNNTLNDLNPNSRSQKEEFLTKYHLYDGKPMTQPNFDRVKSAMEQNDKYSNIKIDLAWENGQRVLRVFNRAGTPLYDINPEPAVPKTKEEKIVEQSLKRLYDIRNKFKNNPNFSKNVALQAKVESINNQIKEIQEENTVHIITAQAKDKLGAIEAIMNRDGLMSTHDIIETKQYLNWYANIRNYINYNEAFEEENKTLDDIVRKSIDLNKELDAKKQEAFVNYANQELKLGVDLEDVFNKPNIEVGHLESSFESGYYSTSQKLQVMEALVRKAKLKLSDDMNQYQEEITPLFKQFQKKYKDYNVVLQLDKNGKPTGRLLNKYSQDYYDELLKRKGNSKEQARFFRENTELKITDKDKETYDTDIENLKEELPDWNKEGAHDKAKYTQWIASHNPNFYLSRVKKGEFISKEERQKFKQYVTATPSDKWLDPRYQQLKKMGEDSIEMKIYNHLETEFRAMSKKYGNEANYIPEMKPDILDRIMQGNWKGAYDRMTQNMQDAISVKMESKVNSNLLDIDGVPIDSIPVYHMSNIMNSTDKSYDLGRVLLIAKMQEFMLAHKNEIEPYLNFAKELIHDSPASVLNQSGDPAIDENGNDLLDRSVTRTPNLNEQATFIPQAFLYDKGVKQSHSSDKVAFSRETINSKGEKVVENRAIAGSKVSDALSSFTRVKTLGLNPVSSVGRIIWGTVSTAIYAGDRVSYGEREAIKSFGVILNASIPGTEMHSKVKTLAKYFDMRVQIGEMKFGKLEIPSINNPFVEATPFVLVNKTEDFIQHQTGVAVLMKQKVTDLSGKQRDLFDAFDNNGKWKDKEFGVNPYDDIRTKLNMVSLIQDTIQNVHGDYGGDIMANKNYMLRALLVMRKWLPRSMSVRFGKEYIDLQGNTQKGRYRSYLNPAYLTVLPLIKDMYKAFNTDAAHDSIDTRNMRMNAYELAFIPVLWGVILAMKGMLHSMYHDDDREKAMLTFLLNSSTRVSGDLTFFFNPYSFDATIREPIPAFKTIMDLTDLFPAVVASVEGKGIYKTGIHKGQSKLAVKLRKALPIINQPDKIISATKNLLDKDN